MVEDEFHVLLKCPTYSHIRVEFLNVCKHKVLHFNELSCYHKFIELFSILSLTFYDAKACNTILTHPRKHKPLRLLAEVVMAWVFEDDFNQASRRSL